MKNAGLCSVTFRDMSVEQIIELANDSGLDCIEWGGDVHVPPGDTANARRVGELTRASGIKTLSYGSYCKCRKEDDFEAVSAAAEALGASIIRIWAGEKDSEQLTEAQYIELVSTCRRYSDIAKRRGQTVAFEHHFGTCCNTAAATVKLLRDIGRENVRAYWQPKYWHGEREAQHGVDVESIAALRDYIVGVHVYNWVGHERLELSQGKEKWLQLVGLIGDGNYYLEFVKDNDCAQFGRDAKTLCEIIKE